MILQLLPQQSGTTTWTVKKLQLGSWVMRGWLVMRSRKRSMRGGMGDWKAAHGSKRGSLMMAGRSHWRLRWLAVLWTRQKGKQWKLWREKGRYTQVRAMNGKAGHFP